MYTTVYTKAEEARVNRAYELFHMSGFPSYNEAIHLVEDGNITGLPGHTADDVWRAYELYGQHPTYYVHGKTVKMKTSRTITDDSLVLDEKKQTLYTDIMHLDGEKFMVTVCEPLQLTIKYHVEREMQNVFGMNVQGQLEMLRSVGS